MLATEAMAAKPQPLAGAKVERFKSREEWLAARRSPDVIGASEAAMALGVSPYGTAWSLWESKRVPRSEKREDVLQRGHRWEPAVLAEYEDESKVRLVKPSDLFGAEIVTISHRDRPWLRETPDAFAIDCGVLGQVEAKTAVHAGAWAPEQGVTIDRWDDACVELVPAHYAIQGYVQLAVTDLPWVDLCALVPKNMWLGVRWVRLMRDVETQGALVEALAAWREKHLVQGIPPDLDGSDACTRYLASAFPSASKKPTREAKPDEVALMRKFHRLRAGAKLCSEKSDLIMNMLLERAAGHRLTIGKDAKAPYGQPQATGGGPVVSISELRAEAPDLVARHTTKARTGATFRLYRFDEGES